MDVREALDAWQAQYSGQPPVGFMLRFSHEDVWTRVHYLQGEGGRNDDQSRASHFDALASALFTGTTVLVLGIHIDPSHEATAELRDLGAIRIDPPSSWLDNLKGYLQNPAGAAFVATTLSWQRGCLDRVLVAVARDRIARVAVFAPATGDAFCPYGGGADIFVWGAERKAKLGDRFRDWVPDRGAPGGLPPGRARDLIADRA